MQRDQEIVEEQLIMLVEFCESGAAKGRMIQLEQNTLKASHVRFKLKEKKVPQILCNLVIGLYKEKIAEEEEDQANQAMELIE